MKKKKGFSLIFLLVCISLVTIFGVYISSLILQTYKETYDNTRYDVKMIIQKNTSGNNNEVAKVKVLSRNDNSIESIENAKLDPKALLKGENYNIEIVNKDDNMGLNLKDSSNNLIGSWQLANRIISSDVTVVLQMDTDIDVNLYVKANNETGDKILYIYFTKIKSNMNADEILKYSFQNEGGIIQTYSNVYKKVGK